MAKIPTILGPDGRPVSVGGIQFTRDAAKRTGSMSNWMPRRLYNDEQGARERETIIDRSINLINDDPNAAGIIDNLATTIIGAGLSPNPSITGEAVGISKDQARVLEAQQKTVYKAWAPTADAAGRMTDGEVQHLKCRCLFGFGESLELIHMRPTPAGYSMCSQVINPLRLKTPSDKKSDGNIKDGVEIGKFGEAKYFWIKQTGPGGRHLADTAKNFVRIPAMIGHRHVVLHDFITKDPGQFRGYPLLSPAMRFFRDLSDLLGAELTSNVITAALSVFVEASDPYQMANSQLPYGTSVPNNPADRKQFINPGEIWYGSSGQKPHLLSADRPGNTFEPFTKLIKKSIAMPTGIPYTVLFKDLDGVSYAGFRSAMLEAWRVFDYHRARIGQKDCQKKYTMLMEEAYLRGELDMPNFYDNMGKFTACNWYGAPKGDIEPAKAISADIAKWQARVKPLEQIIIENGGSGLREVADQIEEELALLSSKGLLEEANGNV